MPEAEFKRPGGTVSTIPSKRYRKDIVEHQIQKRLSSLAAPIVLLTGHEGEIYTAQFNPDGEFLASAGYDRKIFFWNVYGQCENFSTLSGHTGAIMEIQFSTDGSVLFSCSTDKSIRVWDMDTGAVIRRLRGHQSFVNAVHPARRGPQLICSGSDDGTVKVWDARQRDPVISFQSTYQVTAVTFNDTSQQVISGGLDNDIKVWDVRACQMAYKMRSHIDTITGLRLSGDGNFVLSNSMDQSARVFDIRPYAPDNRCLKVFQGHQHNFEKNLLRCAWSADGKRVSAGSADRYVFVWDAETRRLLYKLPGHNGSVNQTDFHPKESIVLSASSDKQIFMGEIE